VSYEIGIAADYLDLADKMDAFLLKGHTLQPVYTGSGDGRIDGLIGTAASVQEVITVVFSSTTEFTVAGSVTGSMGTGTVGTAFSHEKVSFTISAGSTPWAVGDAIAVVLTPPWSRMRLVSDRHEYIWKAPGNSNADEIYVGIHTDYNASADWYDWQLNGFVGYSAGAAFGGQPGAIPDLGPRVCLWAQAIPYWFFASGRRVIMVAKVSTVYETMYLGLLDCPYMSPGEYPYPLVVGGTLAFSQATTVPGSADAAWRWSNTGTNHAAFWRARSTYGTYSDGIQWRMRRIDGVWRGFACDQADSTARMGQIWPYYNGFQNTRKNLDGTYPLFPIIPYDGLVDNAGCNVYGEVGSMMAVPGEANASENTVTIGRENWLVVQDTFRTGYGCYCAIRMD